MENVTSIHDRWKTAEEFYLERDDRTTREVTLLTRYVTKPVEILIDPRAAHTPTVQQIALLACNLTARWARHVLVRVPPVALAEQLVRDGHAVLGGRILAEMRSADPFGDFAVTDDFNAGSVNTGEPPLRLFVGQWADASDLIHGFNPEDYFVDAFSWTARGRRRCGFVEPPAGPSTAAAAALAASLGAADLFKRAVGHIETEWLPDFAWCTWSHTLVHTGTAAEDKRERRQPPRVLPVPATLDLGNTLLAGVGAIGSALVYIADFLQLSGRLTLLDRDLIETSNLNRSPLFTAAHASEHAEKTLAAGAYLTSQAVEARTITGTWHEHRAQLAEEQFDLWVSLTNEDGAWASVPFQLPPVVLHGTTTSGWGFGAGRHIPRLEDCTLCRLPRPAAAFRGPCAQGEVAEVEMGPPVRASLPFLSAASAAVVLAEMLKLSLTLNAHSLADVVTNLPNDVAADLRYGLPAVVALKRVASSNCRGCKAVRYPTWETKGGSGKYRLLSGGSYPSGVDCAA